ncbi:MAG: PASTA domain-containing protein [Elusimicrobiota bacterium]|nr:PASTA domain-containing protein [Endomicrobiia bacterium]MDW8165760.1 PASTA domain-containing protein [Elusimicrobiota bacterium]
MPEEVRQLPKGASILIVLFISLVVSFVVSFFSYFFIFPQIEKRYLYVRVPDIRKLPLSEATKLLQSLNLNYNVVEEKESEEIQAGCIISQQPLPKTLVKKYTEVLVVLSKGVELVKVPDVRQKSLEEAKRILVENGLDILEIKEAESDTLEKGFILSQEPQPGVEVKKGFKVNLVVSKGKLVRKSPSVEKVVVPDVTNRTLIEAKKILESKGLNM